MKSLKMQEYLTHPLRSSVSHVSHQEPQQLGVILVAMTLAVFIALPLVFLHHLSEHQKRWVKYEDEHHNTPISWTVKVYEQYQPLSN